MHGFQKLTLILSDSKFKQSHYMLVSADCSRRYVSATCTKTEKFGLKPSIILI